MKAPIWIIAVAVTVGFAVGWIAKPAPEIPAEVSTAEPRRPARPPAPSRPPAGISDMPPPPAVPPADADPASLAPTPPEGVNAPMVAMAEARKMREQAKMMRLAEVLGLSPEQQDELQERIERAGELLAPDEGNPFAATQIPELEKAGAALADGLSEILTPEQQSALDEMMRRQERNRIEAAAHRELAELTARVDLTDEQREQALERLREAAGAEAAGISRNLALMLETSVLPVGAFALSREAVPALRAASGGGDHPLDQHGSFVESRRQALDARLEDLSDLLTPAQRAAHEAAIREKQAILDQMRIQR